MTAPTRLTRPLFLFLVSAPFCGVATSAEGGNISCQLNNSTFENGPQSSCGAEFLNGFLSQAKPVLGTDQPLPPFAEKVKVSTGMIRIDCARSEGTRTLRSSRIATASVSYWTNTEIGLDFRLRDETGRTVQLKGFLESSMGKARAWNVKPEDAAVLMRIFQLQGSQPRFRALTQWECR